MWPPLRRARGGLCLPGLSPDVGRELLTNFSVLHYSAWEARVQIINFWCLLSLSDRGPCEHIEAAFPGLACAGCLACWPAWQVFGNRSPGREVTSETSVGMALPAGPSPGWLLGEGHLSSGEGPGHGPQGRTKRGCSMQPAPASWVLPATCSGCEGLAAEGTLPVQRVMETRRVGIGCPLPLLFP